MNMYENMYETQQLAKILRPVLQKKVSFIF